MEQAMLMRLAAASVLGVCGACLMAGGLAVAQGVPQGAPPATEKRPVTDTYHGVKVVDDYRWLENWDDPQVKAWSEAQNGYARAYLDGLPDMPKIKARVSEIMTAPSVRHSDLRMAGKRLLAMRRESSRQQPMLVSFDEAGAMFDGGKAVEPRIVLDPAALKGEGGGGPGGGGAAIDWYRPSPDGELVAVSVSRGGSESGDVRVLRVASGEQVGEIVPRAHGGTAGGSLAWTPDSKGFYYTRYPRAGERPAEDMDFYTQVYFHALGTDSKTDRYEVGKDFPKIAEIELDCADGGTLLASVQNGDGGEFIHLVRDAATGQWTQFTEYTDRVVQAVLGGGDHAVYMVSRKDAPRGKLLRLALPAPGTGEPKLEAAKVIVPEQADTLVSEFMDASNLLVTPKAIYAAYQLGGPSEVRVFDHAGREMHKPDQPAVAAAGGLAAIGGDRTVFSVTSFVQPVTWYVYDAGSEGGARVSTVEALSTRSPVDFSGYETVRETATSKDGTKVPVNIVRKRGMTLDGTAPCVVSGYGGYGVNEEPRFVPADMALLEQGFVLAVANIRGGGEFGEAWHLGGNLAKKQNVFDDFAAACGHMVERKYTNPKRLAIEGGSNGGLLMGAELTQHPEMFKAVVSHVGIYDMLRVELSSNGAFNIPEFGTVKDEGLFKAMYAYSPLHNVKDGTAYPATLFLTGANDPRVDPMQSRKFTARLQAAVAGTAGAGPILLRTSGDTGHGMGTPLNERIAQNADVDAFLMKQLGVEWKAVGR
jgi:prolyl oligopeptidase